MVLYALFFYLRMYFMGWLYSTTAQTMALCNEKMAQDVMYGPLLI